jgi:hypothetical protein
MAQPRPDGPGTAGEVGPPKGIMRRAAGVGTWGAWGIGSGQSKKMTRCPRRGDRPATGSNNTFLPDQAPAKPEKGRDPVGPRADIG